MLLVPPRPQSPWAAAEGLTQSSDPDCLSAVIYIYLGTHTAHKENIYCCGDLLPAFQAKCLTKLAAYNLLTSLLIFPIVAQHSFKLYSFTLSKRQRARLFHATLTDVVPLQPHTTAHFQLCSRLFLTNSHRLSLVESFAMMPGALIALQKQNVTTKSMG